MVEQFQHLVTTAGRPEVEVAVPATSTYLAVLRTAAVGVGARMDFTVDEIEDLRIAVDEACMILLRQAAPGGELRCRFYLLDDAVAVTAAVVSTWAHEPDPETFSWTVLTTLSSHVAVALDPPIVTLRIMYAPATVDAV